MRRLAYLAGPIVGLVLAATAAAGTVPALDRNAISSRQCTPAGSGAKLVVDVTFRLLNYADSGFASEWALDTVNRRLRIWHRSGDTFCAQIADTNSTFVTLSGPGPAGGGYVADGIKGTFEGGYITDNIVGAFSPQYRTRGKLGEFDAKCDSDFNCPGKRPSWLSYFKNPSASQFVEWGWVYDAGPHGAWIDQRDVEPTRTGNITN